MEKYLRVHEVAAQLNVSTSSVRRYVNNGSLESLLTPTGQRVFTQEQVDTFLGKPTHRESKKVYYARSSDGDSKKINSQFERLKQAFGEPDYEISDKASGLNDKRKGLRKIFALAKMGEITDVYVTQPDRLTRFGLSYIEEIFSTHDVTLHWLEDSKDKTLEAELLQDFMSLIASFSGKFYRLRGYAQQRQLIDKAKEELREKENNH